MKAPAFDYVRPGDLPGAVAAVAGGGKPISGGQSLGPLLNLRLAYPYLLVDLRRLPELRGAREEAGAVVWGAAVTHAEVEDGKVPDPTGGVLARIAGDIAYRPVRNRGTVGGSLAHADPAADWVSALALVGAEALAVGPAGERVHDLRAFLLGPFTTRLAEDEVVAAVRIPRPAPGTRIAYWKSCRKTGEFAQAIGGVLDSPSSGLRRAVVGATDGAPVVAEGPDAVDRAHAAIDALEGPEPWRRRLLHAALDRAAREALA